jgi:hypothetical protein
MLCEAGYGVDEFRTSGRCSACGGEWAKPKTFRVCGNPGPAVGCAMDGVLNTQFYVPTAWLQSNPGRCNAVG